ncbi:MAG: pyroglutamyl-peptidase I [Hyphomicrobiaceae bacterium]|nr:pyroglutamyl-peptidase I [Hyphomicrobiaceae bacterium]
MAEDRPTTVLLTGFGPFPGVAFNASSLLVRRLAPRARRRWPLLRISAATLPTEWERGPSRLSALLRQLEPDIAIHFGVSARALGLEIETTARNARAASPDARDHLPSSPLNAIDGPETRASTLPVDAIVARLAASSIPGRPSDDAGDYLCNAILYRSLECCAFARQRAQAGFVHIPSGLIGAGDDGRAPLGDCPLDWTQALDGAMLVIEQALERYRR